MKNIGLLLIGLLLVAVGGLLVWQHNIIHRLQTENASLRQATSELQALRDENARQSQGRIDPAELERLRAGQLELARLRGQVAQLRRQASEVAGKRPAPLFNTPPAATTETAAAPVETFTATTRVAVPWKQTLVTGGWTLPSGKRALVFIQPNPVEGDQTGQVDLQARIVEMPDATFTQLGLVGLKSGDKQSTASALLTAEQAAVLIKALEQTEGVNVISAPRVTTLNGRQAQVKVVDMKTAPSGEQYEVGPSIDLVPQISADRASVELSVSAHLSLPTTPAR